MVKSENAEAILRDSLGRYFELKESSIGLPKIYLGRHVRKVQLDNGFNAWVFSSSQYEQAAVKNIESYLEKEYDGRKLKRKANAPFITGYDPELDLSPELNSTKAQYYQALIGVLQWMVEIGRIDMITEVSMMASHVTMPRE